ncbi:heme ABC transporter ATP-binding protein [soil metagenome]
MTLPLLQAPLLSARGVGFAIDGRSVLDGIDLDIDRGQLVALIGPNGAGKSTLLHLLAGDSRADSGVIELDGRALHGHRAGDLARRRAVLTQSNDISFPFTVTEVVEMGRAPWQGVTDSDHDDRLVARALHDAELHHLAERRMPELSGGERARSAYARVRAQESELILLDEPTASLDIRHQERVLSQLRGHARAGGTAIVVLHDLNLAAAYADRIVLLAGGRIRADGTPVIALDAALLSEVYRHPIGVDRLGTGELFVHPLRGGAAPSGATRPDATEPDTHASDTHATEREPRHVPA